MTKVVANKNVKVSTVKATAIKTASKAPTPKVETVEEAPQTGILDNFDFAGLKRKKQRIASNGASDLVAALAAINPDIQNLKVGQAAKILIADKAPDGTPISRRGFIMSITAKVSNLCAAGREWAGRHLEASAVPGDDYVYVYRYEDREAIERKKGGGRKPKVAPVANENTMETVSSVSSEPAKIVHNG